MKCQVFSYDAAVKTLRDSEVGPFCVPLSLACLSWGKLCNLCVSHFKILSMWLLEPRFTLKDNIFNNWHILTT